MATLQKVEALGSTELDRFGMVHFGTVGRIARRLNDARAKVKWGIKAVGVGATARGTARLGYLMLRSPKRARVKLRSGPVIEFGYPKQLPYALVMFGDVIDPEYAFLRKVARPGWVVVDVGAAIGQFTVFAATLPCSAIHSFEPSSVNVELLRQNIELNGVADITHVHQLAFSNVEGEARFETNADPWTSGLSQGGGEVVSVRMMASEFGRLGLSNVSVLKINVAGFEPSVIEGGAAFLSTGSADIVILLLGLQSLPLYEMMASYGYRFFYFQPEQSTLYEVSSFDEASVLNHRPWPARHIIAVHRRVMDSYIGSILPVVPLPASSTHAACAS